MSDATLPLFPAADRREPMRLQRPSRGPGWRLLPSTCVLCGGDGPPGLDLCAGCLQDLPSRRLACRRCARPLPRVGTCGPCQRRPPVFDAAVAGFDYAHPVDWLVQRFKFGGRLECGRVLAECLAREWVARDVPRPDAIVPVPLHWRRLQSRGFDQAVEVGRWLSRRLEVELATRLLVRRRSTGQQTALDARQRRRNLRGAFRVRETPPRDVALVDDVLTTGSTAAECARVLKRAGCRRVRVWVAARA